MSASAVMTIDFETYGTCDLKKAGAWVYAEHPETEVMCMAFILQSKKYLWVPEPYSEYTDPDWAPIGTQVIRSKGCPLEVRAHIEAGGLVEAHNAEFELAFLRKLEREQGWPHLKLAQLRDSMATCAYRAVPQGLDAAAKALRIFTAKDTEGYKIMMKMCKPNNKGERFITPESYQRLCEYCVQDVVVEHAISDRLGVLPKDLQEMWTAHISMMEAGVPVDLPLVENIIKFADKRVEELKFRVKNETSYNPEKLGSAVYAVDWFEKKGKAIPDWTKATVSELLLDDSITAEMRLVLETRQETGKASVKKAEALLHGTNSDSRIRGIINFHAASTGRFGGRRFQPQNIAKAKKKGEVLQSMFDAVEAGDYAEFKAITDGYGVMPGLSDLLRGCIKTTSADKELICSDYSAIELRVGSWLAEDSSFVKAFEDMDAGTGFDPYIIMASQIEGCHPSKIGDPSFERDLGKCASLGCLYGMSWSMFFDTCNAWGIPVSEDKALKAVSVFRGCHPDIVEAWKGYERSAVNACTTIGSVHAHGLVRFKHTGEHLLMKLPSGRCIWFPWAHLRDAETPWGTIKPQINFERYDMSHRWVTRSTYGGSIFQSAVQGTAADILMAAILRCDAYGFDIVFHVHDEIIAETKPGQDPDKELKRFAECMSTSPSWAVGCPIHASYEKGWHGRRYRK